MRAEIEMRDAILKLLQEYSETTKDQCLAALLTTIGSRKGEATETVIQSMRTHLDSFKEEAQ